MLPGRGSMKIIYLDQFLLKKAFCTDIADPHRQFLGQVRELCLHLAKERVASFPFSQSHLKETALLSIQAQKERIAENIAIISNGYRFAPAVGVPQIQACAVRRGELLDWSADKVVYSDTRIKFGDILRFTERPDRDSHDTMFKPVLAYWQTLPQQRLSTIAERDAKTYARIVTQEFAKMMKGGAIDHLALIESPFFGLFTALERDARKGGVKDSVAEAYRFICDRIMEVPCIHLAAMLWQEFAMRKHRTLHKVNDPANTAEDIEFISCLVPYCDAAFLDKQMTAWLTQSKLWIGYKTILFSFNRKDEFLQYLYGLEKDHVSPISEKAFAAFETERLTGLRKCKCPLLWICLIPTHPNDLVRSKAIPPPTRPESLVECRILPGGGVEWVEAISGTTNISTERLGSLLHGALERIFRIPREGSHVSMKIFYSLVNCKGMKIQNSVASQSGKIENDLFRLGVSDWLTESPNLLWPKPDEILAAHFQRKRAKPGASRREITAQPTSSDETQV